MSELPLRPFGFGEVLDFSFQLYRRDFAWYTLAALLGLLPAALLTVAAGTAVVDAMAGFSGNAGPGAGPVAAAGVFLAGVILIETVVKMALAGGMAARMRGALPPDIVPCYKRGLGRLHRIAAAAVAPVLGGSAVFVLALVAGGTATALAVEFWGVFAGLGAALLFAVPAVAVLVWLVAGTAVLLPIVVVEDLGAARSLRRSFRLARGDRWRMAALVGVAFVMLSLPSWAVAAFAGTWERLVEGSASVVSGAGGQRWLWEGVGLVVSAATMPLWVACHMVLYRDRRVRAEGYDIEAAADALAN